jgi:hypothetical protein
VPTADELAALLAWYVGLERINARARSVGEKPG